MSLVQYGLWEVSNSVVQIVLKEFMETGTDFSSLEAHLNKHSIISTIKRLNWNNHPLFKIHTYLNNHVGSHSFVIFSPRFHHRKYSLSLMNLNVIV